MMQFITYNRFDLMAKLLYIKYGYYNDIQFYKNLYTEHIRTFNNFWEYPGTKTNKNDFINNFNKLILDMEQNGYNKLYPITIGKNNVLINGSHRLMCSYYFNINPFIVNKQEDGCIVYNYDFFKNRNNYWKKDQHEQYFDLNEQYIDRMALEYMIHKKNTIMIYIYPIAFDILLNNTKIYEKILQVINKYGNLYYEKDVNLTELGLQNVIKELYRGEKWIGGLFPNNTGGKYNVCKSNNKLIQKSKLLIIDLNQLSLEILIKFKLELRTLFALHKHSIHIPDSHIDSLRIAKSLLNKNTIDFYNKINLSNIDNEIKKQIVMIFKLKENDNENFYITSGLSLPIKIMEINNKSTNIEKEICYDPNKHYYINGFKFLKY